MNLPFVGSEIGLISNSDIRFQGILHSINPNDSTVALEQVRSFGTEDRRQDVIAPSDQIFSYIVFKGSDIKDLYVISAPKESSNWNQNFNSLPPGMNPYYAQQAMAFHQQQQQQYWQQQNLGYNLGMIDSNMMAPLIPQNTVSNVPANGHNSLSNSGPAPTVSAPIVSAPTTLPLAPVSVPKKVLKPELDIYQGPETGKSQKLSMRNNKEKIFEKDLKREKGSRKEINVTLSRYSNGRNTVSFDLPEKPKPEEVRSKTDIRTKGQKKTFKVVVPDSEFDFATANAKFDKPSIQEENAGSVFYQKSSFFDDISCEVKDRASANTDRKQRVNLEKNQNLETFGTTGSRTRGRGRGRGRGRSFRRQDES